MKNTPTFPDNFPNLKTERLILRQLSASDAPQVLEVRAQQATNRYIGREAMQSLTNAEKLILSTEEAFQNKKGISWAAELKTLPGKASGFCGIRNLENDRAEIGGEMHPYFYGRHLAEEAFQEIVRWCFEDIELGELYSDVHGGNRGAIFLLRILGFTKTDTHGEGLNVKGKFDYFERFSLQKTNFMKKNRSNGKIES